MSRNAVKESVYGGLIGGIIFLIIQMALSAIIEGESVWDFINRAAGILLGQAAVSPFSQFQLINFLTGLVIHLMLSAWYGIVLGFFVLNLSRAGASISGILFGIVLYLVNFYLFVLFIPRFEISMNEITLVAHAAYGGVAAFAIKEIQIRLGHCVTCY
ncbi:MAG TPA: hypothetical protein VIK89_16610 [Cytophagaceae bacterium]